jgi:small subunit ribosomal protein S18
MSQFMTPPPVPKRFDENVDIRVAVDYKNVDDLRKMMTPNGKIYSRKRLGTSARAQREISKAIKRARYMALLPFTDATL